MKKGQTDAWLTGDQECTIHTLIPAGRYGGLLGFLVLEGPDEDLLAVDPGPTFVHFTRLERYVALGGYDVRDERVVDTV